MLYVVFEYCDKNLLQELQRRQSNNPYSEDEIRNIAFQVLSAVAHCHKIGFAHRDIKPENFLIKVSSIPPLCSPA